MANSRSGESVISRVARLLSVLGESGGLSPSELSRRSGVPLSTTYRLVDELVAEGLLHRSADGLMEPSRRLWEITTRGTRTGSLVQIALPFMQEVQSAVRQHTVLSLLDRTEVLYLHRLSAPGATRQVAHTAARLPAHACSSGQVLLAHGQPEVTEQVLQDDLSRLTGSTVVDPEELRRLLAGVRRVGYAVARGCAVPESMGIAVPVLRADRTAVAALSVIVPVDSSGVLGAIAVLRRAATAIARELEASTYDESSPQPSGGSAGYRLHALSG